MMLLLKNNTVKVLTCIAVIFVVVFFLIGFDRSNLLFSKRLTTGQGRVDVYVKGIEKGKDDLSLITGVFEFEESFVGKKVNLNCIEMKIKGKRSSKTYVDSITSMLAHNFEISDNMKSLHVYWSISGDVEIKDVIEGSVELHAGCKLVLE